MEVAEILASPSALGKPKTTSDCGEGRRPYYQAAEHANAMRAARLPFGARILFEELVRACGRNGYTWVLQTKVAELCRVSVRTVQRWESLLVKAGLMSVARVSFWARWLPGGVRRVAVPHLVIEGHLRPPPGILDGAGKLIIADPEAPIRRVRKTTCRRHAGRPVAAARCIPVSLTGKQARSLSSPSPGQRGNTAAPTERQLEWCRQAIRNGVEWLAEQARQRLRSWGMSEEVALG